MGAHSSAEQALRSTLRPPLYGGGQGVVGTLKLDAELSRGNCGDTTRDDKGNQTGEILRCAVQVYAGPGPQAMLTAQPVAYAAASHGG
jgi:hypothetical protein